MVLICYHHFPALSWNCPLPGNFHSKILDSIKEDKNEEKVEIVFPSLPPALVESKESVPVSATEFTVPESLPQKKKHKISRAQQRKARKSRMQSKRMYCEIPGL
jgi:hypothetical protein